MDEWSTLFTVAAVAGVLLILAGAWMVVRVLRARKPTAKLHDERDEHRSHSSGSAR
jgi:ABC-type nickel/cobalt efflux system permease component RcnA